MARSALNYGGMEDKKGPSFFKIIKTGFNTEDLRIPPKFRKHLLNELSETAILILKDSPKCSWTVEVSRQSDGEIYLKHGWQKFVKDHSLGNFEFLVFRYERDMHFSVEIFDRSTCKRINFPGVIPKRGRGRPKNIDSGKQISSCQSDKLKEIKDEEDNEEEEAASLPKFPAFKSIIGKNLYNVSLPIAFSRKKFPCGYYNVILKNLEGEKWEVRVVPSGGPGGVHTRTVKLSAGWRAFREDNKINCGDTCTFHLVERRTFVVHIDRK